jgi:hemolysin activation/secretion protein
MSRLRPPIRLQSIDAPAESHRKSRRQDTSPRPLHPASDARSRVLYSLAIVLILAGLFASSAPAQVLLLPNDVGDTNFRVSTLELEYARDHPDHPPLNALLPLSVELRRTEMGWGAPREGEPTELVELGGIDSAALDLDPTGLVQTLGALVSRLHEEGLYGVDVRPSSEDFDLENERDLRPADRNALRVVISVGRIARIRTIAVGDRVTDDWKIDNEIHTRIREASPLQPSGAGDEDSTDLLNRRVLEDYLYRVNRHSGRRVEAALSPAEEPGEIVLDFRILESKPWFAYAQLTNTGTNRTSPWQTRAGFTQRQLTDRDDILSIEYLNTGGDDVNSINARYQAPFFSSERPDWMSRRRGDPEWIDWLPREDIPWWGVDRMRWEVDFSWNKSRSSDDSTNIGLANDRVRSSQYQIGGRFIYEALQYRNLFVDLWGGLRIRELDIDNTVGGSKAQTTLLIPRIGVHVDRISQLSTLGIDLSLRAQPIDNDRSNRISLGRADTSGRYAVIDFNLGYSTFLEPLFRPEAWLDPSTHTSSTLAHEVSFGLRGQYGFDYRLIPQANGALGGLYSVRGYNQSVAVGDTVVIASLEYRFHLPRALPVVRKPLRLPLLGDFRAAPQQVYGRPDWDLTFRAFVDAGRTIRNDRSDSGGGAFERNQTLVGAGVGAELQIKSNFRARVDWAVPLTSTSHNLTNGAEGGDLGDSEVHALFSILF